MINEEIRAFKGFNSDMTCRGFRYKEGKEYERKGDVTACESGFHACEHPLDCFGYYMPSSSVFHEVTLSGKTDKGGNDSKIAASHIRIGARLDIASICKAAFQFVRSRCTNEHNAEPGLPATAGNRGAATAGNRGAATAGDFGAATAGDFGAATAGDRGAATAGDRGAATAGNCGAATAGDFGAATARGKSSSGVNGLSVARGNDVRVRGGMGAILVIAEEQPNNYDVADWKAAIVDGNAIKPGTWYRLVNGEFVECND